MPDDYGKLAPGLIIIIVLRTFAIASLQGHTESLFIRIYIWKMNALQVVDILLISKGFTKKFRLP